MSAQPPISPNAETRPVVVRDPLADFQPIRIRKQAAPPPLPPSPPPVRNLHPRPIRQLSCLALVILICIGLSLPLALYLFAPGRTNILLMGVDRTPEGTALGRTDTMVLTSVLPAQGKVNLFSIPRDLWVTIPNVGENRINTAHFFAEAEQTGSGPAAAVAAVEQNFGVTTHYYVRVRFDGFIKILEAMDGITLQLDEPASGYEAGTHQLTPDQALAFIRDRKGTDDFFRMAHTQIFLKSMLRQLLRPATILRYPQIFTAVLRTVDTNIPVWLMPRLGFTLLRAGPDGIESRTFTREMTTSWTTPGGAMVLLPNWEVINPVLMELFGQ